MHMIVVGISHKTAPVEIREKLAVPESRLGEALGRLCAYPGVKEGLLLSTCNRVEVYAIVEDIEPAQPIDQSADVMVDVLQEPRVHLHLATEDGLESLGTIDAASVLACGRSGDRASVPCRCEP